MSSRRTVRNQRIATPQRDAGIDSRPVNEQPATPDQSVKRKRGREQPRAADFLVTFGPLGPLPISERELRAIEILLGNDLKDLLADDINPLPNSKQNRR